MSFLRHINSIKNAVSRAVQRAVRSLEPGTDNQDPEQPFQRLINYPLSETTTVGENIIVEKGTTVVWLNHYFHHNPDIYSEPMGEFYEFLD